MTAKTEREYSGNPYDALIPFAEQVKQIIRVFLGAAADGSLQHVEADIESGVPEERVCGYVFKE
jgi:hypothetical protein